ncbi:phosphotransferase [candidate division KSB3 bacterium]|uniref:Phosphotransferase n=1 Tax=candidate division KSB3 bacterium TaxID=2044937 RepID=A0A9D5JX67_9BACT|nr:phosphotransferase [candidate division KSB3 bacterium]MBD3325596.1 phosphotransferase [candidate division KSB3 bacterium]
MEDSPVYQKLVSLFEEWSGEHVQHIAPLPQSGSSRTYYRLIGESKTAVGVLNADRKENAAFLEFSKHFQQQGLAVPAIYAEALEDNAYLMQDLGDTTLFSALTAKRQGSEFPEEFVAIYKRVLEQLPRFQILGGRGLNYGVCYPRAWFDQQSMLWDLNYFKYYFLKLADIPFDEQALEDDFHALSRFLLQTDCSFFLYRDFQSRNIMLCQGQPYFIDYQGGRKGALQYDVASLLYDAKAAIPDPIRQELLAHYLDVLSTFMSLNREEFIEYYDGYVLIRMMQAMGAYGFRGLYEQKAHFQQSISYALTNLERLLDTLRLPVNVPTLIEVLHRVVRSEALRQLAHSTNTTLTVRITSFSYKRGIPVDETGNGGGFVFDCRPIHNPGRYAEYQHLTGKDAAVVKFFQRETEIEQFLAHVFALVERAVETYQQRNFPDLMVNFGCTGGQHRSVYCAERLAAHLAQKYAFQIILQHREQDGPGR